MSVLLPVGVHLNICVQKRCMKFAKALRYLVLLVCLSVQGRRSLAGHQAALHQQGRHDQQDRLCKGPWHLSKPAWG